MERGLAWRSCDPIAGVTLMRWPIGKVLHYSKRPVLIAR
jgi:hypothetical protein